MKDGDEVSVARFIADQRTSYRVPRTVTCLLLGVSLACSMQVAWSGQQIVGGVGVTHGSGSAL